MPLQSIYGTDEKRGLGLQMQDGGNITDSQMKHFNSVHSAASLYFRANNASENESFFMLSVEHNDLILAYSIYTSQYDIGHRTHAETHGYFFSAEELHNPGKILSVKPSSFCPLQHMPGELAYKEIVSDILAAQYCGLVDENGKETIVYLGLIRCVFRVLEETTNYARTLHIYVKDYQQMMYCLQAIYAKMPYSFRTQISATNVPCTHSVLSFVISEDLQRKVNGFYFRLSDGMNNVDIRDFIVAEGHFVDKVFYDLKKMQLINKLEDTLREDWTDDEERTQEHMRFLTSYLDYLDSGCSCLSFSELERRRYITYFCYLHCLNEEIDCWIAQLVRSLLDDKHFNGNVQTMLKKIARKRKQYERVFREPYIEYAQILKEYEYRTKLEHDKNGVMESLMEEFPSDRDINQEAQFIDKLAEWARCIEESQCICFLDVFLSRNIYEAYRINFAKEIWAYENFCLRALKECCGYEDIQFLPKVKDNIVADSIKKFSESWFLEPKNFEQELEAYVGDLPKCCQDVAWYEIINRFWEFIFENPNLFCEKWFGIEAKAFLLPAQDSGHYTRADNWSDFSEQFRMIQREYQQKDMLRRLKQLLKNIHNYELNLFIPTINYLANYVFDSKNVIYKNLMQYNDAQKVDFLLSYFYILKKNYKKTPNVIALAEQNGIFCFINQPMGSCGSSKNIYRFYLNQVNDYINHYCSEEDEASFETIYRQIKKEITRIEKSENAVLKENMTIGVVDSLKQRFSGLFRKGK